MYFHRPAVFHGHGEHQVPVVQEVFASAIALRQVPSFFAQSLTFSACFIPSPSVITKTALNFFLLKFSLLP